MQSPFILPSNKRFYIHPAPTSQRGTPIPLATPFQATAVVCTPRHAANRSVSYPVPAQSRRADARHRPSQPRINTDPDPGTVAAATHNSCIPCIPCIRACRACRAPPPLPRHRRHDLPTPCHAMRCSRGTSTQPTHHPIMHASSLRLGHPVGAIIWRAGIQSARSLSHSLAHLLRLFVSHVSLARSFRASSMRGISSHSLFHASMHPRVYPRSPHPRQVYRIPPPVSHPITQPHPPPQPTKDAPAPAQS